VRSTGPAGAGSRRSASTLRPVGRRQRVDGFLGARKWCDVGLVRGDRLLVGLALDAQSLVRCEHKRHGVACEQLRSDIAGSFCVCRAHKA
jgi:hypothetical protein